tara:strand:+ start:32500 stop:33432 length:933 start_codon:yes stop_codon:yes gene_type:complete
MMRILFVDKTHPFLKEKLEENNFICDEAYNLNINEIEKIISKYSGLIIRSRFNIDYSFIDKAHKLKFIARAGSGIENIDVNYAKLKNIKCFNAAEGNRQAVAEHAIGMIIALFNNINIADLEVRKEKWIREKNRGIELSGKTFGIIGFGNNGSALAKCLHGFNVHILAYDKYLKKHPYQSTMEKIFKHADIISLHVPLTEETKYMVDNDFIRKFEKDIYLINTARGGCVNTKDLVKNLKKKKVLGACLDVLEFEQTSFEKISNYGYNNSLKFLYESKKVILTPHIAGLTVESNIKISKFLAEKILSEFRY